MTEDFERSNHSLDQMADDWLAGKRAGKTPAGFTVEELLNRLVAGQEDLAVGHLLSFSDLSREDAALVRREWPTVPADRRIAVVRALTGLVDGEFAWHFGRLLRIALDDAEAEVRRMAIDGLWTDEDTEVDLVGPLIRLAQTDPDTRVRAAAARALGTYVLLGELEELDTAVGLRAEDALMAVYLNEGEDERVRSRALEGLAYSSEIGVRQLIEDAYYSPDEEMRVSSLVAMGRSADVRWRGLARAELGNPAVAMRAAAAHACGDLEAKAAVDELVELVADEQPEVKFAAIFALGQIGGKTARDVLEAIRLSDDPEEVAAADDALEELMLFSGREDDLAAFDDSDDEWLLDPWEQRREYDDDDLGEYED